MKNKIQKSKAVDISSTYADTRLAFTVECLHSDSDAESLIGDYYEIKGIFKNELEKRFDDNGLINRYLAKLREDLVETLKELSGDYNQVVEEIEADL